MARYADPDKTERVLVRFEREDLLWRGRVGELEVPVEVEGRLVGPTVLDRVVRRPALGGASPYWALRDPWEFMEPDFARRRAQGHPLRAIYASGGAWLADEDDFVRVIKTSTLSLGPYALRLTVGALGGIAEAHDLIGERATQAWRVDLERARAIHGKLQTAPRGMLLETPELEALRPGSSISAQIEAQALRDACRLLGVDPDLEIRRPRGRPRQTRSRTTEQGDFIAVTLANGAVSARTRAPVGGVPAFTDLAALPVAQLAALREALQGRGADVDVDLLEAYLDVAAPDWRDPAGAQRQISASGSATDDPYEILGVARNAPLEVVTRAYRSAAQALHPDKGHSKWFTQVLGTAYRKVKEDRQGDPQ
jgi:hypothetical protein